MRADSCTCRLISVIEDDSSSVAEATDCTLVEASSEAAATTVVSCCARSAVEVSVVADASSSVEADDTVSTISPTAPSKLSASLRISALRCSAADLVLPHLGFRLLARLLLRHDLEFLDGTGNTADLVLAAEARQHHGEVAAGELLHRGSQGAHRTGNAEDREGRRRRSGRARPARRRSMTSAQRTQPPLPPPSAPPHSSAWRSS